jgi:putative oxidoreductase
MKIIPLIARILLSAIFINSGIGKIAGFEGTLGYMSSAGMPMTEILLVAAIIVEIAGGLMVLLGFKARIGAGALFLFLIPTTFIFHLDFADRMQMAMFMKNLAIMGGLLMVAYFGAGPIAFDRSDKKKTPALFPRAGAFDKSI